MSYGFGETVAVGEPRESAPPRANAGGSQGRVIY